MKKISLLFGAMIGSAVGLGRYIAVVLYDSDRVLSMLIEIFVGIIAATALTAIIYFVRRFIYKIKNYAKFRSALKVNTMKLLVNVVLLCVTGFVIAIMYWAVVEKDVDVLTDMAISIIAVAILFYKVFSIICEAEHELRGSRNFGDTIPN